VFDGERGLSSRCEKKIEKERTKKKRESMTSHEEITQFGSRVNSRKCLQNRFCVGPKGRLVVPENLNYGSFDPILSVSGSV
jgi:hypothetical protein